MYFWKVDSLVADFKSGDVTQYEEFKYMMLLTIASILGSDPALYIGLSYNQFDTIGSILLLSISAVGLYHCYTVNRNGDDKDFIIRIVCLGLPVAVRVLIAFIPIFIIAAVVDETFFYEEAIETGVYVNTPLQVITISAFMAVYFWYLSITIEKVSS